MPNFDQDFPPLGAAASSGKESKEADESWELLSDGDEDHAENDVPSAPAVVVQANPKILHHCASSPNLRCFAKIFEEDDEEEKVEDSSFDMVSNVGSVFSMASGRSFRDAFLSSPIREDKESVETQPVTAPSSAPRPYRKAKMVVVQPTSLIRRCSKSSPNLLGLIHEHHDDDDDDEHVLGDTDAAEYYHRKSKGAQGRSNGMKLRPDEAKRKAFSVNKRNLQRKAGAN